MMARRSATGPLLTALLLSLPAWAPAARGEDGTNQVVYFTGPSPSPAATGMDPADEPCLVHIPSSYTGEQPFGLIVFIPAGAMPERAPRDWAPLLAERRLLLALPLRAVNRMEATRRLGLGIVAALKMRERYAIDPARIYAAGISGGARIAGQLAFRRPDLFRGTIQSCGADFPRPVSRVSALELERDHGQPYGRMEASRSACALARERVRFVLITGPGDFRHGHLLDLYHGGFREDGYQTVLLDIPSMGHETGNAEALARALDFIEQPGRIARP